MGLRIFFQHLGQAFRLFRLILQNDNIQHSYIPSF